MTNHVPPSSSEMVLPVSHCTLSPTSIQTQTDASLLASSPCFPKRQQANWKGKLLTKPSTSSQVNTYV